MTWCNHFEAPVLQKPHPKGPLVHKVQQYLKGDNRSVFKVLAFSCTLLIMAVHYLRRRARYGPIKPIYWAGQWPGRRSDFTQKSGLRTGEGHDVSLDEVPQGGHCLDANHSLRLTLLELKLASPRCMEPPPSLHTAALYRTLCAVLTFESTILSKDWKEFLVGWEIIWRLGEPTSFLRLPSFPVAPS